jgi:hypothetical protein
MRYPSVKKKKKKKKKTKKNRKKKTSSADLEIARVADDDGVLAERFLLVRHC